MLQFLTRASATTRGATRVDVRPGRKVERARRAPRGAAGKNAKAAAIEFGRMAADLFSMMESRRTQGEPSAPLVVVTSARAGEGKTFVAEGLSLYLAGLSARRILLVDASLDRPTTTVRFQAAGRAGLIELLSLDGAGGALEPVETELGNLRVLGVGRGAPEATLLFRDGALVRLVEWASLECDLCVVDAPPLSEPGAAQLIEGAMQGVLVVDSPRTSRDAVARAIEAGGRRPQAWGVVLNRSVG